MGNHALLTEGSIHIPFNWVWADATARAAESVTTNDINKMGYQQDTNQIYVLTTLVPTWTPVAALALSGLSDVDLTGLTDNMVLIYDLGSGDWVAELFDVADINDVDLSGLVDGQVLAYNSGSGNWEPITVSVSDHTISDAVTAVASTAVTLKHNTSGTPATGFGTAILIQADDDTNPDQDIGQIKFRWANATSGSQISDLEIWGYGDGATALLMVLAGPDAQPVEGNARGVGAVDLQLYRSSAARVAGGPYSGILAGENNEITANGDNAAIIAGSGNTVDGEQSVIVGGGSNDINADNGVVINGRSCVINAEDGTVLNGRFVTLDRVGEVAAGNYGAANGNKSVVAITAERQIAHSTNAWFTIGLDITASSLIDIASNSVLTFDVLIAGVRVATGAKRFAFRITGAISNVAGTTSLMGTPTVTVIDNSDDTNFSAQVVADNTNDALLVQVQDSAGAGDPIIWVASLRGVEAHF